MTTLGICLIVIVVLGLISLCAVTTLGVVYRVAKRQEKELSIMQEALKKYTSKEMFQ